MRRVLWQTGARAAVAGYVLAWVGGCSDPSFNGRSPIPGRAGDTGYQSGAPNAGSAGAAREIGGESGASGRVEASGASGSAGAGLSCQGSAGTCESFAGADANGGEVASGGASGGSGSEPGAGGESGNGHAGLGGRLASGVAGLDGNAGGSFAGVDGDSGGGQTGLVEESGGGAGRGGYASGGGGSGSGGGGASGKGGTGPGRDSFGFFVFGDPQVDSGSSPLDVAIPQMSAIDGGAIGAFCTGDLTQDGTSAQWAAHHLEIGQLFDASATQFGSEPRYFSVLGNHDVEVSSWHDAWLSNLSGQAELGINEPSGVYFSVTYGNTLFVMLDSEHLSSPSTSYLDAQSQWLEATLEASSAEFKLLFMHEPLYACNQARGSQPAALPWVALGEQYGADAFFSGHSHVYSRSCPKRDGDCVPAGDGIVFTETGAVGAPPQVIDVVTGNTVGTDAEGGPRADSYDCIVGQGLDAALAGANVFSHVTVDGAVMTVRAYRVEAGNSTPFDTWSIDHARVGG